MGVELMRQERKKPPTQKELDRLVRDIVDESKPGVSFTPFPFTGLEIPRFDALALAQILEQQLAESVEGGHRGVQLRMDLVDAAALARFLRKHG